MTKEETNIAQQIDKQINDYNKIVILRHQKPDFDAIGSQTGLATILKSKYPQKEIYCLSSDDISDFNFIGENCEETEQLLVDSLVIIVDTANFERIEGNYQFIKENNIPIIKIDHHPNVDPYGDINLVDEDVSSTCQYIYEIFIECLGYKLNEVAARQLFIGIYGDTGGFSFSNTKASTFEVVSKLVATDFPYEETLLTLKEKEEEDIRLLGWMYQNIIIEDGIGILAFEHKEIQKLGIKRNKISALVNSFGIFKEVRAWILFVEYKDFIRVNLRSKGNINVSEIAMQYHGGGHFNASGASIKTWEQKEEVIAKLKEAVKEENK